MGFGDLLYILISAIYDLSQITPGTFTTTFASTSIFIVLCPAYLDHETSMLQQKLAERDFLIFVPLVCLM